MKLSSHSDKMKFYNYLIENLEASARIQKVKCQLFMVKAQNNDLFSSQKIDDLSQIEKIVNQKLEFAHEAKSAALKHKNLLAKVGRILDKQIKCYSSFSSSRTMDIKEATNLLLGSFNKLID